MNIKTSTKIDERIYKLLKHYCVETSTKMDAVINYALDEYLSNPARGTLWNSKTLKKTAPIQQTKVQK